MENQQQQQQQQEQKNTTTRKVVVLTSRASSVAAQQDKILFLLKAKGFCTSDGSQNNGKNNTKHHRHGNNYIELVDAADDRERRIELLNISGIGPKYPQVFLVDSFGRATFVGDYDTIVQLNDDGLLTSERLGLPQQSQSPTSNSEPSTTVSSQSSIVSPPAAAAADKSTTTTSPSKGTLLVDSVTATAKEDGMNDTTLLKAPWEVPNRSSTTTTTTSSLNEDLCFGLLPEWCNGWFSSPPALPKSTE